ncbi:MAG: FAD:protein FMN transferase [Candidatus Woesearchaeota archaeon]
MPTESKEVLGTIVKIILPQYKKKDKKKLDYFFHSSFNEFTRIEKKFSRFLDDSELSKANLNLKKWQSASDELIFLLNYALKLHKNTYGYFDITLKSTLDKLGYDKNYSFKEKKFLFFETLKNKIINNLSNNPILIDKNNKKIFLKKEIDFGGFGKGYAVDKVSEILNKNKVKNYFINAGGDIYAKGKHKVVLEHPDDNNKAIGIIEIKNKAIASSSAKYRKWKNYHHLINPKTLKPENSIKSIFVIAEKCIDADAYATALFTSGFENALKLYKKLNVDVLIINSKNKMFISENFNPEFFN